MTEENNLETYLSISPKRYGIYLIDKYKLDILYQSEEKINDDLIDFNSLSKFLDNNIFKIEKFTEKFIKNIYVIIENQKVFNSHIGIKKKNYDDIINMGYLEKTLRETKDLFIKNYQDQNLMHMIIDNYLINGKKYTNFDSEIKTRDFCLVINFISISNNLSDHLEKILEKYQIKIKKYLNEKYITNFFIGQKTEFPVMICKILNGINQNEVQLVPKNRKNKGFFEKFFHLFS
jgi:hypothetical protein